LFIIQAAAFKDLGHLDHSIEAYNKALAIKPDYADAYYNMGLVLQEQGKLEEAIEAYNKALAIKPDYAEAYNNIGNARKDQGKPEEAIEAYSKALAIKPDYAEAYNNMGNALKDQGKLEEAIEAYNKALAIKPDYADAHNNVGNALKDQGKLEEAIEAYNKALAIKPDYADAHNNMGNALKEQGKLEGAIEAYNKALAIKPDDAEAQNNMSFTKLLTSSWREGIELRKWRWHTKKHQIYNRSFSAREWDGNEAAHNKTLLVWAEQGPGDVVIWSSCISHYANIFRKIIIECHPKLVDLLGRSFPNILVRSSEDRSADSSQDFDFQVPMETLFGYACLAGACTETQSSYLFPDPKRAKHWSTKLRNISSQKTVGLSWKSPLMTTQRAKNYPELSHWGKTLQKYKSRFTFVNLQSTDYRDDIAYFKDHFGCEIVHFDKLDLYNDLSDVAALSQALDCSISVATAAATISAAVGTQTIIPTWKQSSWNNILFNSRGPAVDILLKNTSDSWAPVFEEVATKLKVLNTEY
jgi:tetratricopeptide (TPR) repeat protein